MNLTRVTVHNFRAAADVTFHLRPYSVLVGANNAGKSTMLDAIRVFYEKDGYKFDPNRDLPYFGETDSVSIDMTYLLSEEEDAVLAPQYRTPNRTLRLRKYLHGNPPNFKNGIIYGFISAKNSFSDEPFYGAKNVQEGKLGDLTFIPAISKVDDHTKLTGPSPLRDLLLDVLGDALEDSAIYREFAAYMHTFSQNLRTLSNNDGYSLETLERDLNDLLQQWKTTFKLQLATPNLQGIIRSLVDWYVLDNRSSKEQDINQFGSGFQRYFIYALIRARAKQLLQRRQPRNEKKEFVPSFRLVLFEEPEAFLHPYQQEEIAHSLRRLATQDWQVICTTHSSHFVSKDADDITGIIRVARDATERIQVYQVTKEKWDDITDSNREILEINTIPSATDEDRDADMEAIKYFIWLNPARSAAFFASFVLLVEGPTESVLINKLFEDGKLKIPAGGIYVMDCMGKFNIHRFMNLLNAFGIRHSVLYDNDVTSRANYHPAINDLIQRSKGEHTLNIQALDGNFESFLGLPECPANKKPQMALYYYQKGRIDVARLSAFTAVVTRLLPEET